MLETPIHADPLAAALARKALNGASGSISDSAIARRGAPPNRVTS